MMENRDAAITFLRTSAKVANTGSGWDTADAESRSFYRGVDMVARMTLSLLGEAEIDEA